MAVGNNPLPQSLHTLYSDHHGWLYGWLRRRLDNSCDAADLAHDTFVRVLAKEAPIAMQEPRAFLSTVARGLMSNHYRRKRLEQAYLEELARLPEPQVPSPEVQALLLESLLEIDRRLDGLPAPVRRAFLLSQLDGVSQAEIAAALRVSIPTVKRYIVRAVQQCYFCV